MPTDRKSAASNAGRQPRTFCWTVSSVEHREARRGRDAMDGSGGDTSGCGVTPQPAVPAAKKRTRRQPAAGSGAA